MQTPHFTNPSENPEKIAKPPRHVGKTLPLTRQLDIEPSTGEAGKAKILTDIVLWASFVFSSS